MAPTRTCIVTNGVIEIHIDAAAVAEQRRINHWALGHGARNHQFTKRYRVGDRIELPGGEAKRLARCGTVEILPV